MGGVLSETEVLEAALTGVLRTHQCIYKGRRHRYGLDPGTIAWVQDITGALGERAVAKVLDRYTHGAIGPDGDGDLCHGVQVRSTVRRDGCLILHPTDADDAPWVLVTGPPRELSVRGWCFGHEGKREQYWRDDIKRPAYFVPPSDLQPMTALREYLESLEVTPHV